MPIEEKVSAYMQFMDWYKRQNPVTKIVTKATIFIVLLGSICRYYENRLDIATIDSNRRIDSVTVFFTYRLETCNTQNKAEIQNIMQELQKSNSELQKIQIEQAKLRLEADRLKLKKYR